MGRAALIGLALLTLAPAAAWFAPPAHPLVAIAWGALAIAIALHGLGRLVGWAVGDPDAPVPLAIAWGVAAWALAGGMLTAVGAFALDGQRALAVLGHLAGAGWLVRTAPRLRVPRPGDRPLAVVAGGAVALVALHVIGGGATWTGAYADADGSLLGPLQRLATTSVLGDPVGLPRATGLGGTVIVHALAAALGDLRAAHAIDRGLGLGLALALFAHLGRGTPGRTTALALVAMLASATPEQPSDLAPRWLLVAAVLAIVVALRRATTARGRLGAVVLAAGVATMVHGGVVLVAALAIHACRAGAPGRDRATLVTAAAALAVVPLLGYLVALRATATAGAVPWGALTGARVAVWALPGALIGATWYALASLATRRSPDRARAAAIAAAAAAAGAAFALAGSAGAAWLVAQAFGIALVFLVIDAVIAADDATAELAPATIATAVLVALVLATTRFPVGRPARSWEDRLTAQVAAARARATERLTTTPAPEATAYAAAQAAIPAGRRLGVWTDRPDLVDYRRHHVIDLRSLDATACVGLPPAHLADRNRAACARLRARLRALRLDAVLIGEAALDVDAAAAMAPLCALGWRDACLDPLTELVRGGHAVPAPPGVRVAVPVDATRH